MVTAHCADGLADRARRPPRGDALETVGETPCRERQDHLRLRVAQPAVELDDVGCAIRRDHESGIQDAGEAGPAPVELLQGRGQHLATDALEQLGCRKDLPDVDAVVAPIGGGGLLAGIGVAVRALRPSATIYAAEPETAAPLARSLKPGEASRFDGWQASFVDGAGGKSVLTTMWPLLHAHVADSLVVTLDEAAAAMRLVAERLHVIAEGAAACAIAAALSPAMAQRGHRRVVAVVSGGNVNLGTFARLVGAC